MSGTSMDGVDAVLVSFDVDHLSVVGFLNTPYSDRLREQLATAIVPNALLSLDNIAKLNISVGREFANATKALLALTGTRSSDVAAIGSHGQTLRHSPDSDPPYSVQIGDPATIASQCGITTVADFRSLDIASGGQGAPLVPAFHQAFFRATDKNTVVLNIGGIANITILPAAPNDSIEGFDTGPGNCLLDDWIAKVQSLAYDDNGAWGASGKVCEALLKKFMADPYIQREERKSTGREYFNLEFVEGILGTMASLDISTADIQATLAAFTVTSITKAIKQTASNVDRILVCGGGAKNNTLIQGLRNEFKKIQIESTSYLGVDPDMVEALAFAWFAKQRLAYAPIRVTTNPNSSSKLLGAVYEISN